jgi:hypothetical protein
LRGLPAHRDRRLLGCRPGKADHPAATQRGEFVDVVEAPGARGLVASLGRPVVRFVRAIHIQPIDFLVSNMMGKLGLVE